MFLATSLLQFIPDNAFLQPSTLSCPFYNGLKSELCNTAPFNSDVPMLYLQTVTTAA